MVGVALRSVKAYGEQLEFVSREPARLHGGEWQHGFVRTPMPHLKTPGTSTAAEDFSVLYSTRAGPGSEASPEAATTGDWPNHSPNRNFVDSPTSDGSDLDDSPRGDQPTRGARLLAAYTRERCRQIAAVAREEREALQAGLLAAKPGENLVLSTKKMSAPPDTWNHEGLPDDSDTRYRHVISLR
jgi:hypothetical protein